MSKKLERELGKMIEDGVNAGLPQGVAPFDAFKARDIAKNLVATVGQQMKRRKLTQGETDTAYRLFYGDGMTIDNVAATLKCTVPDLTPWLPQAALQITAQLNQQHPVIVAARNLAEAAHEMSTDTPEAQEAWSAFLAITKGPGQ